MKAALWCQSSEFIWTNGTRRGKIQNPTAKVTLKQKIKAKKWLKC